MPRRTVGEELQQLFRQHEAGGMPFEIFDRRKGDLLRTSGCQLPAFLPDPARQIGVALGLGVLALIALYAVGMAA